MSLYPQGDYYRSVGWLAGWLVGTEQKAFHWARKIVDYRARIAVCPSVAVEDGGGGHWPGTTHTVFLTAHTTEN